MKKKLKNTFTGVVLVMFVITMFSFQSFETSSTANETKVCTIEDTKPRIDIFINS